MGNSVHAVRLAGLFDVRHVGKMGMTELIAQLALDDLPILDGHHQIMRGASKGTVKE
jgi:hypothetical protein